MKNMHSIIYTFLLLNSCSNLLFAAEPQESEVYIKNMHPSLQFECQWMLDKAERKAVSRIGSSINLGLLQNIHDIKIKRYGHLKGIGAQYYDYTHLLHECKKNTNQNCVLQIKPALNFETWDVYITHEEAVAESKIEITRPIEYFFMEPFKIERGEAYFEPRLLFKLGEIYTAADVTKNEQSAIKEIQGKFVDQKMEQYIQAMLHSAANYARKLLEVPKGSKEYQKILIEFRGLLHPERIVHGKQVCCRVIQGTMPVPTNTAEYLDAIIDTVWFLYYIAILKGQSFEEGTFVIQDNDLRIYNFLMNYVRRFYNVKDTLEDPAYKVAPNSYAYPRLSSHFLQEQNRYRHYGVDIRYPGDTIATANLPASKAHILFGNLGNGYIFIKLEDAGTAFQSIPIHGAQFIVSQLRKILPAMLQKSLMIWYKTTLA